MNRLISAPLACAFLCLMTCATGAAPATQAAATDAPRWYKGNLHTHSLWSDGDDFPEMIADWYKSHGYDFLAISDHNMLQTGDKWVTMASLKRRGAGVALDKYQARFGEKVITRGTLAVTTLEIKLTPLAAYRTWLEEPGRFLLIQAEEVTDAFEKKPIHMNLVNAAEAIKPKGGASVREVIANDLHAMREQAKRTGQPMLAHLNHPNFGYGVTADDLAAVADEHFFEVYNGHPAIHFEGDDKHIGVERLWDVANTIRLAQLHSSPLMGLGGDDSHNYHLAGLKSSGSGRGWVMVRAKSLDPASLIGAMEAGDFYASSGVTLADVRYDDGTKTLTVEISPDGDTIFTTRFVGTPTDFAGAGPADATALASEKVGTVFRTLIGNKASYQLTGNELYVRAAVTSNRPAENPSFKGQMKQAWTQPVGWRKAVNP